MKRLDRKTPHILENTPHIERTTQCSTTTTVRTQTLRQQTRCIPDYLQNEILFICCHINHTSAVQMCCHIVYHCMQKHKAKLLC